jgi:hypothetical protein
MPQMKCDKVQMRTKPLSPIAHAAFWLALVRLLSHCEKETQNVLWWIAAVVVFLTAAYKSIVALKPKEISTFALPRPVV